MLLTELREFVTLHRPFERWVFPEDAAIDMALLARWN